MIDRTAVYVRWGGRIEEAWFGLRPYLAVIRSTPEMSDVEEHFEFLTTIVEDWKAKHLNGDYPSGARRLTVAPP